MCGKRVGGLDITDPIEEGGWEKRCRAGHPTGRGGGGLVYGAGGRGGEERRGEARGEEGRGGEGVG